MASEPRPQPRGATHPPQSQQGPFRCESRFMGGFPPIRRGGDGRDDQPHSTLTRRSNHGSGSEEGRGPRSWFTRRGPRDK